MPAHQPASDTVSIADRFLLATAQGNRDIRNVADEIELVAEPVEQGFEHLTERPKRHALPQQFTDRYPEAVRLGAGCPGRDS